MNRKKGIYAGIAIVVVATAALLMWRQLSPEAITKPIAEAPPEIGQASEAQPDPVEEALIDSPEAAVPEPSLVPANTRSLGENETRRIREQVVSQEPFPADVSMEQYKSQVWQDIQQNPPPLVARGDSSIDAEYAYRIYMYYGSCSVAPRNDAELDIRINQITARTQNATEEYLERVAQSAEQTFDFYEFCSAIPQDVDARLEAVMWMGEAVNLGHPIAETQYYDKAMGFMLRPNRFSNSPPIVMLHSGLIEEFKSTARFALNRAVDKGHPEAFIAMSQAHLDDIIFPSDPILAMAYVRVAELEAMQNHIIESSIARQRQKISSLVSAQDMAEVEELANRIRAGERL